MSELCITCGVRPRKKGRRQCGRCAWRSEDPEKARIRRREYKRRHRRAQGAEPIEVRRERAAKQRAECEARRAERLLASSLERKPWLQYPSGSAARYRSRYQNDPAFAQRERDRAIVFRFTHPDRAAAAERFGQHWKRAAQTSDGSVTVAVVRRLLTARTCYLCGVELTPANRSIDHIIPISRGGKHLAKNLAPCCQSCNRKKDRKLAVPLGPLQERVPATPVFETCETPETSCQLPLASCHSPGRSGLGGCR